TNGTHDHTTLQPGDDLVALAQHNVGSMLTLTQALLQSAQSPTSLWLVTQNAHAVLDGDGVTGALQATLWGLGRTLTLEHPELNPVQIDLDGDAQDGRQWAALAALMTAPAMTTVHENQLALRQGQAYVARLDRADLYPAMATDRVPVQPQATYLITGGLGAIGLLTAESLVAQGADHLLLVGRSQPRAAAVERLTAWREQGVTVTVHQADVTDRAQMAQVIAAIDPAAPLRGVIHSVGLLDDGVLLQQRWARFAPVLAPKLQGAWHLHELTQGLPLDFFLLFSSAVGLMGNAGQANHAAANTFLDAFAHYRRAQGQPALCINWGVWSEVGAAAALAKENQQALAARGQGVIAPQQGIAAFAHLLGTTHSQVAVMPYQWSRFFAEQERDWPFVARFQPQTATPSTAENQPVAPVNFRKELEATTGAEQRRLLVHHLRTTIARVLGLPNPEQIAIRQGLTELGMDSLMAVELRNHLVKSLACALPATLLFDYPTIEALADYISEDLQRALGEQNSAAQTQPAAQANGRHDDEMLDDEDLATIDDDELLSLIDDEFASLMQ
ncbi:MAG: SDR family NAD(P)-dependent oxidoreductase, partial [Caldilineaceae bacterium]|nr:SDR family NAD(P)-dependent oxidoreductase [Caldilineaceae bacterium]